MGSNTIQKLIKEHQWTAILQLVREETELRFADMESFEAFRATLYRLNAFDRTYTCKVNRREKTIKVGRIDYGRN